MDQQGYSNFFTTSTASDLPSNSQWKLKLMILFLMQAYGMSSLSVPSAIAARQRGLLFNKRRARPFSVGTLSRQLTSSSSSLTADCQSLGDKPLETHDQIFYFRTERLRVIVFM
jgi:hypothetical protein